MFLLKLIKGKNSSNIQKVDDFIKTLNRYDRPSTYKIVDKISLNRNLKKSKNKMKNKKTILLSGASRGIGLDIATKLVKNKYNLIVCSRSTSKELNNIMDQSDSITHYKVDLESNKSTNEFLNSIQDIEFYGLINNAGYAREGILATLPEVEIEKMININLKSSILLSRFFSRNIIKYKTSGRIINISSIISDRGFNGLSVYSATKAGLNGLTLSLARAETEQQLMQYYLVY